MNNCGWRRQCIPSEFHSHSPQYCNVNSKQIGNEILSKDMLQKPIVCSALHYHSLVSPRLAAHLQNDHG